MTVGLIGYGRLGRLAARYLTRHVDVCVYDPRLPASTRRRKQLRFGSLAEAASQKVVVLAVPVSSFRAVLRSAAPHLRSKALVIDTCAVKRLPARWMKQILPGSVEILATHPLFGPDSAARNLAGKTIVLCPVRIARRTMRSVTRALHRKGLKCAVMTVEEHDRMAAETILLAQYLGRLVGQAALHRWPRVTSNYANLLRLADVAEKDSFILLADMVRFNTDGPRVLRALRKAERRLTIQLHEK